MVGYLQPLDEKFPIVGPDGKPTLYFIRWAQQKQIDIGEARSGDQVQALIDQFMEEHQLREGSGISLTPDGNLLNSPEISANAQEILDQLSTTQGSILFRGASGWEALAPGTSTQYLKSGGPAANPLWDIPAGGGGSTQMVGNVMFGAGVDRVVASGSWVGVHIACPTAGSIGNVYGFFRAITATSITPAVYACNSNGTIGSLVAQGPTVSATSIGINEFPLSAPLSVSEGDMYYIGFIVRGVNSTSAPSYAAGAVYFAASSNTPPTTPPATTYGLQASWIPIWCDVS